MKWYLLFFFRGISLGGPYNTQEDCLVELKKEIEAPIFIDRGFDKSNPTGLCFQAIKPG